MSKKLVFALALLGLVFFTAQGCKGKKKAPAAPKEVKKVAAPAPAPKIPALVSKVEPTYPEEAKKQGIEGDVVVKVTIDEQGNVTNAEIVKSPNELLNDAALGAVKQWKYEAPKEGELTTFEATVSFKLEKPVEKVEKKPAGKEKKPVK